MLRPDSTATLVEQVPEAPFYIPGTGSSTRPRRTLKHGDCFDSHADIGATPGGPDGIFFCDTRYLSQPLANRGPSTPRITSSLARAIISGIPNTREAT